MVGTIPSPCATWPSFLVHLLTTIARLIGPGGARAVVAESLLVKHQLLVFNRSRQRAPNLRSMDRTIAGLCALLGGQSLILQV